MKKIALTQIQNQYIVMINKTYS